MSKDQSIIRSPRTLRRIAVALLCFSFLSLFAAPEAQAACPSTFSALGTPVELVSCTEQSTNGNGFTMTTPAGVVAGDLLVAVVVKVGTGAVTLPGGWTSVSNTAIPNNEGRLVVARRVASGSDSSANYNFNWSGGGDDGYGFIMRFTGAASNVLVATATGGSGNAVAPTINSVLDNSLVLRVAGRDRTGATDPATIVSGHVGITQQGQGNGNGSVMGAAAYRNQATAGSVGSAEFINLGSDQWAAATLIIQPSIEFRFSMPDAASSVCGQQAVTLSVTNSAGTPLTWFNGTVTLSTSAGGAGDWYDAGALAGTLNNGTTNDGVATYQFVAGDNGVATFNFHRPTTGSLTFNASWGTLTENPGFDPTLTIDNACRFRISHDGDAGSCSVEPITISIVDSSGTPATFYSGSITISAIDDNDPANTGTYTLNTGTIANFADATPNDGIATYTFAQGESQVVLDFAHPSADSGVNFNVVDSGNPSYTVDGAYDPDLVVGACSLRFSHAGSLGVCTVAQITLSVVDDGGQPIAGFEGSVDLSVDSNNGTWSSVDGAGTFTPGSNGTATYEFIAADGGDVILGYQGASTGTFNFNATTGGGIASPAPPYDDDLTLNPCTAELSIASAMNVCSESETLTITIRDHLGNIATGFEGTVVISNDTNKGDFAIGDGAGSLDNGSGNDGLATYEFDLSDGGDVALEFSTSTVQSLVFSVSSAFTTFDSGASDENLQVLACEFRIAHDGEMDNCTPETVTISVFNALGVAVTDYVGTVNLSTSSLNGTWANSTGNGAVVDPVAEDGSATYEFVPADNGSVQLLFSNLTVETMNINVSEGPTTDSNPSFDPVMEVVGCTIRITLADGLSTACAVETVTISVYNSSAAIANNFTGTVSLSTNTVNGSWADAGALNGTLTDATAGDGAATYEFVAGDNGVATFSFTSEVAETLNFNAEAGDIGVDSGFDPDLEISGCVPTLVNYACFPGTGSGTGNISISGSDPGRMVIMIIYHVENSPQNVTGATVGGNAMTQIYELSGSTTGLEMWGILNDDLPASAGSYAGAYTWDAAPAAGPSMCMVELGNVKQEFPIPDGGAPTQGAVNGNIVTPSGNSLSLATTITTAANNAIVLSASLSDNQENNNSYFDSVTPEPPMARLLGNSEIANPDDGTGAISWGIPATAAALTVTDYDNRGGNNSAAHIVASFIPRVSGIPAVEDYEPVAFYETFSGNIGYRAIGASFRTAQSQGGGACNMVNFATGDSATLAMPAGSTVRNAYLYWAGSGEDFEADNTVTFGPTGSEISITADELFLLENAGGSNNLDFFAGFKDVTAIVSANGSYTLRDLTVQTDKPWSQSRACVGGWALVVIYDNAKERFRVANLFHGFQPVQNSSFVLTAGNFRLATTDNDPMGYLPNGEFLHITVEGDENASSASESVGIETAPGSGTYNSLTNSFNPANSAFNSTVTRPLYYEPGDSDFFEWNSTAGTNSDGYEIDEPGGSEIGETWGVDIDAHYLTGNDNTGELWNFAQSGSEAEELNARFSTGFDLVMVIAELITVTNFDLADLEIFKSQSGSFKVGGTGQYQFQVVNNGNNGLSGGHATGQVLVADTLPTGLTLASVSGTDWDCSVTSSNAFTCAFDIATDCDAGTGCSIQAGELSTGESLPLITANINVADSSTFPLLSQNVKNVARLQHNGGGCGTLTAGVIPDPATCVRAPQFDNKNDLNSGAIDINDLDDKTAANNNVHSVITEIRGLETDLGINKQLVGTMEVGSSASYTLTVTNYGPDATTGGAGGTITVTDVQPSGITFTGASGTGWSCSLGPLNCTYAGTLANGASTVITVDFDVVGAEGANVTNTAQVASGLYNFDTINANDADTEISTIVAAPVSSGQRFVMSVRVPENTTQIGGLATFENDDLIIFNPLNDTGTLFFDNSANGDVLDDVDAVHIFNNGHVALSTNGTSTLGATGVGSFEPEDIISWDPILDHTTMLFDGSSIFDGPIDSNHNVDAVYVRANGNILFSVEGSASITFAGPTTVNFNQGDIVEYDPSDGSASILIDASDANIFNGEVQIDGLYVRADPSDADANQPVYILTVDESSAVIGSCGSCDPSSGTTLTRDDIVEIDLSGNPVTANQFVGHLPLGVFSNPSSNDRTIDAVHVMEDEFFGHFAIVQSQAGTTCQAGQITIRKHKGLTHTTDTNYTGSVLITTDLGQGDWEVAVGSGSLDNGTLDDGAARYTFAPGDNGEVTLYLTETTFSTLNVNVTNGIFGEAGTEDPNFTFNFQITEVTYRENWDTPDYDNHDGSTFWATDWLEVDGLGSDLTDGNIVADSGQLEITASAGDPNPEISRQADLSLFTVTETVFLNLDYSYQFLNSGSDVINIDVSLDGGSNYTTVHSFSGIGGTNLTPQALSLDLDSLLGSPVWSSGTRIRFRVAGGYTGTSRLFLDNIELKTGTTDCGIGSIEHYEVRVNGTTGNAATLVSGLQCLSAVVTVTGHDLNHFPSAGEEAITLRTSTDKGDWILAVGQPGSLNNGTPDDGIATYTFAPLQQSATFIFNYTNPTSDPEQVNFNVSAGYPVNAAEDPTLNVYQAGLIFYNETDNGPTASSPIPTQIAGKASNVLPNITILNIEGVRTSDNNPLACSPLFDAGNTLTIEFAAECLDPGTCSGSNTLSIASLAASNNAKNLVAGSDNGGEGTSASYQTLDVQMTSQPNSRVGGEVYFSFADAGQIEIHARYQVPLNEDISGASGYSEGYLSGSSAPFVVRPFGFDIDFSDDRFTNGTGGASYGVDANADVFTTAGIGFDTTVSAVAWEQADDMDNDGVPDQGAALGNNAVTPNFGNESTAGSYEVIIERERSVLPLNSTYGSLEDNRFSSFAGTGFETHSMTYDEVGIIDLTARLVDTGTTDAADYLNTGINILGNVKNVGRFIPGHFELSSGVVQSRPLTATEPAINTMPTFTYMGEEFGVSATVTVFNGAAPAAEVHNYVGDLAKLGNRVLNPSNDELDADKFRAVDSSGSPVDLSTRLGEANSGTRHVDIDWEAAPSATSHAKTLSGNLIFHRATPAAPDGPLTLDIGLATTDPDSVPFTLDLDVDGNPGADAVLIQEEEFRYGRLVVENAFGSELEPLGIGFTVEYWDSSEGRFVVNTDDSTTTINYDASEDIGLNRSMFFVSGTFTDNLVEDLNDVLQAGETFIEATAISGNTDVVTSINQGRTLLRDNQATQRDTPFYASAPGENYDGTAIVEFNLTDSSLPFPLDFLSWDWRGAGETEDVNADGNYSDNPRGQVGFGSFRGHDRVLNWQEIYTSP